MKTFKAIRYSKPINFGGPTLPNCEIVKITSGTFRGARVVIAWGWHAETTIGYVELPYTNGQLPILGFVHS